MSYVYTLIISVLINETDALFAFPGVAFIQAPLKKKLEEKAGMVI